MLFDYIVQRLISIWSVGEETSRVLAFLSIMRLLRLKKEDLMEKTLKVCKCLKILFFVKLIEVA